MPMATEDMHRLLGRTDNDGRHLSIRRNFEEENRSLYTSLEDWEEVVQTKIILRSAVMTLLSLDPGGNIRILTLPLASNSQNSSGRRPNMSAETLRLFYTKPTNPLAVIRPTMPEGSKLIGVYCGQPLTNGASAVSFLKQQFKNTDLAIEASESNEVSSSTMEIGSSSKSFSDSISGIGNVQNTKRNSINKKRKKRRKGKKKVSGASRSKGPKLLSLECADGSSASGTCEDSGESEHSCPLSPSTAPECFLPESGVKNDSVTTPCTDYHEELDTNVPYGGNVGHGELQDSELSLELYQKLVTCSASVSMAETLLSSDSFSDSISGSENADNVERNSVGEKIKEGKEAHDLSGASSSTETHSMSVEDGDGSSPPGTCGNSRENGQCGPLSLSTSQEEALLFYMHSTENLGNQIVPKNSEIPTEEVVTSIPPIETNHFNDLHARGSSDMEDSSVSDLTSVDSNCDDDTDGQDKSSDENELFKSCETSCSSVEGYVSCESSCNDDAESDDTNEGKRQVLSPPVSPSPILSPAAIQAQKETSYAESSGANPSSGSPAHYSASQAQKETSGAESSTVNPRFGSPTHNSAHIHSEEQAGTSRSAEVAKENTQNVCSAEVAVCAGQGSEHLNLIEAGSMRIQEAVRNAWRVQLEADSISTVTGYPIAEFERLVYHASPVIHESPNFISCETCSKLEVPGSLDCPHQTADIALKWLWKWYKRCGSYGLEVRAEDFRRSEGLGADRREFSAYFVPYLSGIQLFRSSRSDLAPPDDSLPETSAMGSRHLELLFEYFESEQPQHREPLYGKINDLIGSDQLNSNVYGDPTILKTINLNDLHPRSWYAVAWYPIYRIPHGHLRAAFLTYHSFGHFVLRSSHIGSSGASAQLVSPVVGLQSYNAQGECWFQERPLGLAQRTATSGISSSGEVLKERLRTLEETASLMARSSVQKGSTTSATWHPDYEFFRSRNWRR